MQLAYATDMQMFKPALVSLASAAEHCKCSVVVHFLGYELTSAARKALDRVAEIYNIELRFHDLTSDMFESAVQKDKNISLVTLGRMYLPKLAQGRLLYVDCDTLVCGDLSPLFDINMNGALIGAVRDVSVLDSLRKEGAKEKARNRLIYYRELLGEAQVGNYFNAGVLLMDCDGIRAEAGLCDRMIDMKAASQYRLLDQDYLNLLFQDRVCYLSSTWNSIWKRENYNKRVWQATGHSGVLEATLDQARIIHYTGPHKPWKPMRVSTVFRNRLSTVVQYRSSSKRLLKRLEQPAVQ